MDFTVLSSAHLFPLEKTLMQSTFHNPPDLDGIARNLSYLDLAHLTPEESTAYEHELSVLAALNEALETTAEALQGNNLSSGSSSTRCSPMPPPCSAASSRPCSISTPNAASP